MRRLRIGLKILLLSLLGLQGPSTSSVWAGHHYHGGGYHHGGVYHYHHRYSKGHWYGHHGRWYGPGFANRWSWNTFGALAGAAVISDLVSRAFEASSSTIVVPDSSYALDYDSIRANGNVITFKVDGAPMRADCRSGTLDGHSPESRGEAQLVNAACTAAFGF